MDVADFVLDVAEKVDVGTDDEDEEEDVVELSVPVLLTNVVLLPVPVVPIEVDEVASVPALGCVVPGAIVVADCARVVVCVEVVVACVVAAVTGAALMSPHRKFTMSPTNRCPMTLFPSAC